jgi:hypothetical protein
MLQAYSHEIQILYSNIRDQMQTLFVVRVQQLKQNIAYY